MTSARFTVLPDERLDVLRHLVVERMKEAGRTFGEGAFDEFFDRTMAAMFTDGLHRVGAHEGTLWLLDESRDHLVPRFNSGPHAASFVGSYRQSLSAGMISMVVAMQQPICENEVHKNQRQDPTLDRRLGVVTCAMLAVPFYFVGELRGVISGVQLKDPNSGDVDPPGFSPENLLGLQLTASVLARLIEHELMSLALGLEDS